VGCQAAQENRRGESKRIADGLFPMLAARPRHARSQPKWWAAFPGFVLLAVSLAAMPAGDEPAAGGRTLGPSGPPLSYRIDEVTIRLARKPDRAGSIRSVSLSGKGSATVERDGEPERLGYPPSDLLKLLNEFYRIRFFDLPEKYTTRYSVFLKEGGVVGTSALRMADAASTLVCINIGEYRKCVTFGRDGPLELESVAKQVFLSIESMGRKQDQAR
jgi:hypothetical protein